MSAYVYNDEDNYPMNADSIGYSYPIRTWDEMIKAWEERQNEQSADSLPTAG